MKKKTKTVEQVLTQLHGKVTHTPRTTDLDKFIRMIRNQAPGAVVSGEWTRLEAVEHVYANGDTDVKIPVAQVVFCFSNRGRLKGIANWKQ